MYNFKGTNGETLDFPMSTLTLNCIRYPALDFPVESAQLFRRAILLSMMDETASSR